MVTGNAARREIFYVKPNGTDIHSIFYFFALRINLPELGFAFFLLFCACYDIAFGSNYYHIYIFFQSFAFFVVGLGYVGTFISSS